MVDRVTIKQWAKSRMSGRMGLAILVAFIAGLLGTMNRSGMFRINFKFQDGQMNFNYQWGFLQNNAFRSYLSGALISLVFVGALLAIAYIILVANVITTGGRGWFLRYSRGEYPPFKELFAGFRIYSPVVTTGLLRTLYVFLWMLLLIIPGIVKSYAYSMTDYIIYENPNLPAGKALDMSDRMTHGYKGDLFVLDLSFIGWNLLSVCTLGLLGIFYVNPYMHTTHAGFYEALKANALQRGVLSYEDFGMAPPAPGGAGYYGQPQGYGTAPAYPQPQGFVPPQASQGYQNAPAYGQQPAYPPVQQPNPFGQAYPYPVQPGNPPQQGYNQPQGGSGYAAPPVQPVSAVPPIPPVSPVMPVMPVISAQPTMPEQPASPGQSDSTPNP